MDNIIVFHVNYELMYWNSLETKIIVSHASVICFHIAAEESGDMESQ